MYNLSNKNKKLLIIFLVLFISISSLSLVKTDYYFMSPGPPYQWDIEYGNIENYEFEALKEFDFDKYNVDVIVSEVTDVDSSKFKLI